MFYCVYFFSPFHLNPILACLFSQSLVASYDISGFPKLVKGSRHLAYFPLLRSSLHLECSFSQILSLFPYGEFLLALQGPARMAPCRREASAISPSASRQSWLLSWLVSIGILWLLPPEWVIMGAMLFVPLGAFRAPGPCLSHL